MGICHGSPNAREDKEVGAHNKDSSASLTDNHGVEPSEEFKPVEHPQEPTEKDQPVRCPPPEPSILHDGRIWKERVEASARRRSEFSIINDFRGQSQVLQRRQQAFSSNNFITPSFSCPEHSIVKLLDECASQAKS
eukprot:TRINITY_DN2834_c0_g1_i1.p1 TRINITY_DN2834_c0_g1~~TRINITY_DN2834_c0_g1_i1.p1  ORF type:complete len:136 (+),score=16.14 TRINITY_DN2834_c0_g1_i1:602-1009(+)